MDLKYDSDEPIDFDGFLSSSPNSRSLNQITTTKTQQNNP